MAAAREEEEGLFTEAERDVAAILCGLKKALRARDRRRRRRMQRLREDAPPEIPCWGRRRPRSMPEEKLASASASPVAAPAAPRDGAASPDTPLAYPESGGDDAPAEVEVANKPAPHQQWVQEQHGVVASLSQENAHLLKVRVKREQDEQERKRPRLAAPAAAADPRAAAAAALGLDLNEPARAPEEEERARAHAQAMAAAAAAEWYRQVHLRAAMQKAAVSAGARRRRLEILRAKVSCPLVSSRPRRAG